MTVLRAPNTAVILDAVTPEAPIIDTPAFGGILL